MNETELLENFQSFLAGNLSEPVRTGAMEEEYPVPVVILDDWSTTDFTFHNTPLALETHKDVDNDGTTEHERVFRFYYETRVEYVVRHTDEVACSNLKTTVKNLFRELRLDPSMLHNDANTVRLIESGNPLYQMREPKETEEHIAALVFGFHQITKSPSDGDFDPIQAIENEFTVEGTVSRSDTVT